MFIESEQKGEDSSGAPQSEQSHRRVSTADRGGRPAGTGKGAAGRRFVSLPGQQLCEILVVTLLSSLKEFMMVVVVVMTFRYKSGEKLQWRCPYPQA